MTSISKFFRTHWIAALLVALNMLIFSSANALNKEIVRWPISRVPSELNNLHWHTWTDWYILTHILGTLLTLDISGNLVGNLAAEWNISPDYKEFKDDLHMQPRSYKLGT